MTFRDRINSLRLLNYIGFNKELDTVHRQTILADVLYSNINKCKNEFRRDIVVEKIAAAVKGSKKL